MAKFYEKEGVEPPTDSDLKTFDSQIEYWFTFALIWSIGATCDEVGRSRFSEWTRSEMKANGSSCCLPTGRNGEEVYDFRFDQASGKWKPWMDDSEKFLIDNKLDFSEIIVPTNDSVRNTYLMNLLLMNKKHVLMVGDTGTGKTVNINQYLLGSSMVDGLPIGEHCVPINITFSAQTSANMTQDMLDNKMEKRRKGIYGPAAGKQYIVYVDDLNMPKREVYGAQPPIEILRQWFDQGGWYDRKELTIRKIIDINMICSMGPPGGGRQEITARFLRHFNIIGYTEMKDNSKFTIFNTILGNFLSNFESDMESLCEPIVNSTIELFNTIVAELLPTPAKSHYTFNLRDLAKVFQGVLMMSPKNCTETDGMVRLWVHECKRVFYDRLTNNGDKDWFEGKLKVFLTEKFDMSWSEVIGEERLIYGDYMVPGADPKYVGERAKRVSRSNTRRGNHTGIFESYASIGRR